MTRKDGYITILTRARPKGITHTTFVGDAVIYMNRKGKAVKIVVRNADSVDVDASPAFRRTERKP